MNIRYGFASASDVDAFYGERPPQTIKAIAIYLDDEPVALAGLDLRPDHAVAFSEYKPAFAPYLKRMAVLRAVKAVQKMIFSHPLPVYCQTDNEPFLERLGFKNLEKDVNDGLA